MRTPRKDMFVNITAIIWIITNLIVYLITLDLAIVAVINMGFLLFLFLTLQDKKIMKWLNEKKKMKKKVEEKEYEQYLRLKKKFEKD